MKSNKNNTFLSNIYYLFLWDWCAVKPWQTERSLYTKISLIVWRRGRGPLRGQVPQQLTMIFPLLQKETYSHPGAVRLIFLKALNCERRMVQDHVVRCNQNSLRQRVWVELNVDAELKWNNMLAMHSFFLHETSRPSPQQQSLSTLHNLGNMSVLEFHFPPCASNLSSPSPAKWYSFKIFTHDIFYSGNPSPNGSDYEQHAFQLNITMIKKKFKKTIHLLFVHNIDTNHQIELNIVASKQTLIYGSEKCDEPSTEERHRVSAVVLTSQNHPKWNAP